jgi:antitoxin component YwqK of YwqJK toxin-antitoxin module
MTEKLEPVIEYYDDGTIKYAYHIDENGIEQGPYEEYHENGRLKEKCTYKDGKYDGPYEEYHDNGQLKVKYTYKDGEIKDGAYKTYYRNGGLSEKFFYKEGKIDGPYEIYSEDICSLGSPLESKSVYKMGRQLESQEAMEYLNEWYKKYAVRKILNARLRQIDKQMAPTQLRQSVKRSEVAQFRAKFPYKHDGR